MEDRQPRRLHIELVRSPDTLEARAAAIAAAGWSVSTWVNATDADHDGMPRREARCDGVVIGESDGVVIGESGGEGGGDGTPESPEPPSSATTVVPLGRYPRPSQGSCSGEPTTGILLVLISPKDESGAQALRDWGDFVHLRRIAEAAVPGYRTITPWEHEAGGTPRYCHLYEMVGEASDDPQAIFERMTPLVRQRLDDDEFRNWAWHPQLVIDESRAYRRVPTA